MSHAVPRSLGSRRGVAAPALAILAGAVAGLAAPAQAGAAAVPASQPLVVLLHDHVPRARPSFHARRIEPAIPALRPLTRVRTVLPVLAEAHGNRWLRVRLPGRPNGHTGWIRSSNTRRTATGWRLALDLSERRLTVYRDGRAKRRFPVIVGNPWTPTPRGRFFVEEAVALGSQDAGNPFALATSARSNVLQEFEGGPGQIALHGTNLLSGTLGTAASHGCIRLGTAEITWLAHRVGSGVPLHIAG